MCGKKQGKVKCVAHSFYLKGVLFTLETENQSGKKEGNKPPVAIQSCII